MAIGFSNVKVLGNHARALSGEYWVRKPGLKPGFTERVGEELESTSIDNSSEKVSCKFFIYELFKSTVVIFIVTNFISSFTCLATRLGLFYQ